MRPGTAGGQPVTGPPERRSRLSHGPLAPVINIIRKDRLAQIGLFIMVVMILVAVFAPWIATHDPDAISRRIEGVAFRLVGDVWQIDPIIGPQTLNAVRLLDEDAMVAVGNHGEIATFAGNRWTTTTAPVEVDLHGVAFAGADFGVAVGQDGHILHYDGRAWQQMPSPTDLDLHGVDLAGPRAGLAVGKGGTVLQWDGTAWHLLDSGAREDLASVSLVDAQAGFVVGERSVILEYDGESLQRQMVMGFRDLAAVHAYAPDLAVAVGARGTIMRYNGQSWSQMFGPESRDLRDVRIVGPNRYYAIGAFGILMEYDGNSWQMVETGYRRHFRSLDVLGDAAVAVGTDPYTNELAPPSGEHYFGTTHLGRDIFSQVVYGSRTALRVGFLAALMVTLIGVNVGLMAGYYKGRADNLLMRIVDIMYAVPFEPFAMVLVLIFNPSQWIVILAVGLLTWRTTARVIRSQVLSLSERPFIKAAKVAGASDLRILYVHIAPNILPLAFLQLAVAMGFAITAEATLSFLGLGPPQLHSWGTILHAARLSGAWRTAWWWVLPPGLAVMLSVVSVFFMARAMEVLTNPRLERR